MAGPCFGWGFGVHRRANGAYRPGGAAPFSPLDLSPAVWFDPSDSSTLFQDRAGASATTLAGVGDPVGTVLDKSGNGYHATAASDDARPILREAAGGYRYLEFDGTDDYLAHGFGTGGDLSLFVVAERTGGTGRQQIFGAGGPEQRLGALVWARTGSSENWGTFAGGQERPTSVSILNARSVLANIGEPDVPRQRLYTNGALVSTETGAAYAGDAQDRRALGRENALGKYFTGNVFQVVAFDRACADADRTSLVSWMASNSGVTL
jgi:hypothetical protein